MKKVVIFQHRLLHYRLELFERLRSECLARGIELHLVHGQATRSELPKKDTGALYWAEAINNRSVKIGRRDFLWQKIPSNLKDASLIILMQENRILSNFRWLFALRRKETRLAFWGHGRNFQSASPNGIREKLKVALIGRVDWWFAYTELTKSILLDAHYPSERISILNNAIDNDQFKIDLDNVGKEDLDLLGNQLGIIEGSPVGLFCGSLYPEKKLDFLISASDRIVEKNPNFNLIVVGDGPSMGVMKAYASTRPWLKCVGVQLGAAKAEYFRLASIVLNPGLVGLHILDSFNAGIPMITTADALHSPEFGYLEDGTNGLVIPGDESAYADEVNALILNPDRLGLLSKASLKSAEKFTLDNMVSNYVDGIVGCLNTPKK